jgi:hypothetical protein
MTELPFAAPYGGEGAYVQSLKIAKIAILETGLLNTFIELVLRKESLTWKKLPARIKSLNLM